MDHTITGTLLNPFVALVSGVLVVGFIRLLALRTRPAVAVGSGPR